MNTVNNVQQNSPLFYHLSSQDPEKPYVGLIHGLFGDLNNLAMVRRGLEDEFNVLSIDLPDHGQSQQTPQFSFQGYAELILELLGFLSISEIHIVGHSLGGKIAMTLALNHPGRVNKLILADIAPVRYTPRHHNVFSGLLNLDLEQVRDRKHADEELAKHIIEPGVRQFLLKSLFKQDDSFRWKFNLPLLHRDYDLLSEAIHADQPFAGDVLFIKGGNSDYLLAEHSEHIQSLFPNSQAKIIQGTGHWLHAEKTTVFNRIVKTFLQQ